ncbi:MAG: hypothetical protein KKC79_14245, partial [Gammaproteobacteria bacterium]|nr:hypothetical protein [Gammaproteobacteria bacterium]
STRVPAREQDALPTLGGAVFSPFADAPVPPPAKTLAEEATPPAPRPANAGFGLTLVAAAGASAALFWLLRRS